MESGYKKRSEEIKEATINPKKDNSDYLIYERHFDSSADDSSPSHLFSTEDEGINTEDLGIIDLEDDDIFDNIDDDNLPILKNTYSK